MIISHRDKRTRDFTAGRRVKAFSGIQRSAPLKLDRLEAAVSLKDLAALPGPLASRSWVSGSGRRRAPGGSGNGAGSRRRGARERTRAVERGQPVRRAAPAAPRRHLPADDVPRGLVAELDALPAAHSQERRAAPAAPGLFGRRLVHGPVLDAGVPASRRPRRGRAPDALRGREARAAYRRREPFAGPVMPVGGKSPAGRANDGRCGERQALQADGRRRKTTWREDAPAKTRWRLARELRRPRGQSARPRSAGCRDVR